MKMKDNKRILLLLIIMACVSLITGGAAIGLLYRTAFEEQRHRLVDTAQSQARLMEAVARFSRIHYGNMGENPRDAAIEQIKDAHLNFPGFGKTGEFTLAEKQDDEIVFLLSHRHYDLNFPKPVPIDSRLAEPMRRALSGTSGTVIGLDYRGSTVLAAHEFVKVLNLGIVAKIDLSEVRAPFIRTGMVVLAIAGIFIIAGSLLFLRVSEPLIKKLVILAKFPHENPNPVIRVSEDCRILYSNRAGEKLLEKIVPDQLDQEEQDEDDPSSLRLPLLMQSEIAKAIKNGEHTEFEFSSEDRVYNFIVSPVVEIKSAFIYGTDITDRVSLMDELRLNTAVFMTTTEGVMVCDRNGDIRSVNPSFVDITGFQADEVIGRNPRILKSGRHDRDFYENMWRDIIEKGRWEGEIWNRKKSSEIYPQETTINTITNERGAIAWYASIFRDITKRKETENMLIRLSATDGLTGLANRRIFDETLEKEWKLIQRSGGFLSVAMVDIDHFKQYNDNYGHQQGDVCLQQVAAKLKECVNRTTDLVARYGGEEFVIVMPLTGIKGAKEFAEYIRRSIESLMMPHRYSSTAKHITVSVGVGVCQPQKSINPSRIVQLADEALYEAKVEGRNRVRLKSALLSEHEDSIRHEKEANLREA